MLIERWCRRWIYIHEGVRPPSSEAAEPDREMERFGTLESPFVRVRRVVERRIQNVRRLVEVVIVDLAPPAAPRPDRRAFLPIACAGAPSARRRCGGVQHHPRSQSDPDGESAEFSARIEAKWMGGIRRRALVRAEDHERRPRVLAAALAPIHTARCNRPLPRQAGGRANCRADPCSLPCSTPSEMRVELKLSRNRLGDAASVTVDLIARDLLVAQTGSEPLVLVPAASPSRLSPAHRSDAPRMRRSARCAAQPDRKYR